jgi:hypothetical protein
MLRSTGLWVDFFNRNQNGSSHKEPKKTLNHLKINKIIDLHFKSVSFIAPFANLHQSLDENQLADVKIVSLHIYSWLLPVP